VSRLNQQRANDKNALFVRKTRTESPFQIRQFRWGSPYEAARILGGPLFLFKFQMETQTISVFALENTRAKTLKISAPSNFPTL